MKNKKSRHILGISGGKDSAALAIYMRDRIPEMEYFFCDTGSELPETYLYLAKLEKYLGKTIKFLTLSQFSHVEKDKLFEVLLRMHRDYLPSQQARWCTVHLKIKPMEEFIGADDAISYVGLRADEDNRKGYVSTKRNVKSVFPFIEDKIDKAGVYRILESAGVGVPEYYKWRSRSGCFFCFFQRKIEWIGLLENHPDLYKKAMAFEKTDEATCKRFTWDDKESLEELARPERIKQIKAFHEKMLAQERAHPTNKPLYQVIEDARDKESDDLPCLICQL